MGRYGNPNSGLLKRMLDVIYEHGQSRSYDADWMTRHVAKTGFWDGRNPKTPERTVNSYFAQNDNIFTYTGSNQYQLTFQYLRPTKTPTPIDELGDALPSKTISKIYRTLRDTELVRKLKLIHQDRCQICGMALELGSTTYSEGHHIQPLGRRGPDIAGNILILCPNHHVLCDYGAIRLSTSELRYDARHRVDQKFIAWHNINAIHVAEKEK